MKKIFFFTLIFSFTTIIFIKPMKNFAANKLYIAYEKQDKIKNKIEFIKEAMLYIKKYVPQTLKDYNLKLIANIFNINAYELARELKNISYQAEYFIEKKEN